MLPSIAADVRRDVDGHAMSEVKLLRLPAVEERCGLRKTAIYDLVKRGKFPAPIRLTERTSAWSSQAVDGWIAERIAQSVQRA
jgi:prophage regulatory protein